MTTSRDATRQSSNWVTCARLRIGESGRPAKSLRPIVSLRYLIIRSPSPRLTRRTPRRNDGETRALNNPETAGARCRRAGPIGGSRQPCRPCKRIRHARSAGRKRRLPACCHAATGVSATARAPRVIRAAGRRCCTNSSAGARDTVSFGRTASRTGAKPGRHEHSVRADRRPSPMIG
jgi:hypothetical protein